MDAGVVPALERLWIERMEVCGDALHKAELRLADGHASSHRVAKV